MSPRGDIAAAAGYDYEDVEVLYQILWHWVHSELSTFARRWKPARPFDDLSIDCGGGVYRHFQMKHTSEPIDWNFLLKKDPPLLPGGVAAWLRLSGSGEAAHHFHLVTDVGFSKTPPQPWGPYCTLPPLADA